MQITEVSVLGVRTAVVVLRHRHTPLRFVLVPTIHMGRPEYYRRIAARIGGSQVIVAETYDGPSSTGLAYVTAMRLTRQRCAAGLVHQNIDYAALGVPTVWPDNLIRAGRRDRLPFVAWLDLLLLTPALTVSMAVGGRDAALQRRYEVSDDDEPRLRFFNRALLLERDELLTAALTKLHTERAAEDIEIAVVYGAAHMPAVVRTLAGRLGYRPLRGGDWLTAIPF
ncbi:hypothetical protein ACQP00_33665 [Dactylosporangium sp. CS-047395]|uniref:hypothetical protein n=1 Tax=Dactylosporangium sp. CS-047395 TaxID=3239936 RepID=UPI003D8C0D1A